MESGLNSLLNLAKDLLFLLVTFSYDPCSPINLLAKKLGDLVEADFYCGSWLPDWRIGLDYRKSVSARKNLGGGVLLELSHEIDLAQWLLGSLNLQFCSLEKSELLELDVEDKAMIFARTDDGCTVTIRLNFCTKPVRRNLTIRGSVGEIHWELNNGKVTFSHEDYVLDQAFVSHVSPDERYYLQMNHFLACAMKNETPICSLVEGLTTLNLVKQALNKSFYL